MGIDMKLVKREENDLLRVREKENTWTKAHCRSEIAENCMDSSEEWSDWQEISDQPGTSSTYYPDVSREKQRCGDSIRNKKIPFRQA
ncbi:hypothetical protein AVEN_255552-1 [Araneus ventricosus]|uniref:Uncharacterized protein n=1 Tax=Araneus ventricosus TaxID=182803 RepID=A0A4Y2NIU9_ARAVE|nr:hypothetical protein AVEN_255552-1 [Araneus ventricosus]